MKLVSKENLIYSPPVSHSVCSFLERLEGDIQLDQLMPVISEVFAGATLSQIQAKKMTEIGHWAAGFEVQLEHAFKEIMVAVGHLLSQQESHAEQTGNIYNDLVEINKATARCLKILGNLNQFLQPGAKKIVARCSVNDTLTDALTLTKSIIGLKTCDVELTTDCDLVAVEPQILQQLVFNLITNACHALTAVEFPKIWITTSRIVEGGKYYINIMIADNGTGIPEHILPRIFDVFFTTKLKEKGLGLGLSICRELARKTGGEITVTTQVGKGTQFFIQYPITGEN